MVTYNELHRQLDYSPINGLFRWKIEPTKKIKIGDIAGYKNEGYVQIRINGQLHRAHRLAWLYVKGYLPENDIDHIKGIKDDNRIRKLREISRSCNLRNTGNRKNNISGIKGVSWLKSRNKWRSVVMVHQKYKHLGNYTDFDEAVCARLAGEQCLNWSDCDSNSPAYQYVTNNIINRK